MSTPSHSLLSATNLRRRSLHLAVAAVLGLMTGTGEASAQWYGGGIYDYYGGYAPGWGWGTGWGWGWGANAAYRRAARIDRRITRLSTRQSYYAGYGSYYGGLGDACCGTTYASYAPSYTYGYGTSACGTGACGTTSCGYVPSACGCNVCGYDSCGCGSVFGSSCASGNCSSSSTADDVIVNSVPSDLDEREPTPVSPKTRPREELPADPRPAAGDTLPADPNPADPGFRRPLDSGGFVPAETPDPTFSTPLPTDPSPTTPTDPMPNFDFNPGGTDSGEELFRLPPDDGSADLRNRDEWKLSKLETVRESVQVKRSRTRVQARYRLPQRVVRNFDVEADPQLPGAQLAAVE